LADAEVVVVGGGLAGLAAAITLEQAGRSVALLEASDDVGGRVRSDVVEGFLCDRGFQVFNPWYPTAKDLLDYNALDLHPLSASTGMFIEDKSGNTGQHRPRVDYVGDPFRSSSDFLSTLRAPLGGWLSLARLLSYVARVRFSTSESLAQRPDITTQELFDELRLDQSLQNNLLRPFLGGVTLDLTLQTSRRFIDFVLKSFASATPALPTQGMGAISAQLKSRLRPDSIHLNTRVTGLKPVIDGRFEITTSGNGNQTTWLSNSVVLAVDPPMVAKLLPAGAARDLPAVALRPMKSVTTWYHVVDSSSQPLSRGKASLIINPANPAELINTVVLTNAVPSYSPDERALISTSRLGLHESGQADGEILALIRRIYGLDLQSSRAKIKLLARYPIADALPDMSPPFAFGAANYENPGQTHSPLPNLYLAGDYTQTGSIEGALNSGQLAARAALNAW
jgi:phytoene dehydrogenase-like protein